MTGTKSAPDVDLKSRGIPWHIIVGAVGVGLSLLHFTRGSTPSGENAIDGLPEGGSDDQYWLLYTFGWAALRFAQLAFVLFACLLGALVTRQRSILYVPVPPGTSRSPSGNPYGFTSPKLFNLPYEDAWIETEDGVKIHGWFVYHPKESCGESAPYTFAYFHGNAGNIGHRLENVRDMHKNLGINILIIDYRSYGDSEDGGGPSEINFMKDARASYKWLADRAEGGPSPHLSTRIAADRLCLFGRSIGGAVCWKLCEQLVQARQAPDGGAVARLPLPCAVVVENTFTSLRDMAMTIFPFLAPLGPLLRSPLVFDEWKSRDAIEYFSKYHKQWCCCLLSGAEDELVPPAQMRSLHSVLKESRPKVLKYFVFRHGGHNDTPQRAGKDYWVAFQKFMDAVTETESERSAEVALGSGD